MNDRLQSILDSIKTKKFYYIGGALFVIVFLLTVAFSMTGKSRSLTDSSTPPTSNVSTTPPIASLPRTAPIVTIDSYDLKSAMPVLPTSVRTYDFKTNFSPSEIQQLAGKFAFNQPISTSEPQTITYVNFSDPDKMGALAFNTKNGAYSMRFYTGYVVEGSTTLERAQNFVNATGLADSTITCNDSYTREGFGQYTFVACHRDWSKVGLPIYNSVGILNVNERTALSSLRLGQAEIDAPSDPTIIGKTNSSTGKVPPIDFNTITVAVTNDGKVAMAQSNMRPLATSRLIAPSNLLTPQEAYDRFVAKQTEFTLTIPAGVGTDVGSSLSWDAIYPNNQAHAKQAVVSDYVYAYLENPSETMQQSMEPKLIMRGTAQLSSGHTVRFIQIVSALKNAQAATNHAGVVAGDSTYLAQDNSLKLGSFTPSVSDTRTITPTRSATVPTPTGIQFGNDPSVNPACSVPEQATIVNVNIPGVGTMDLAVNSGAGHYRTFYFKSASFSVPSMDVARKALYESENSPFVQQYLISVAKQYAIQSNIAPAGIQSQSDAYTLFSEINRRTQSTGEPSAFTNHCGGSPNFAPPSMACLDELGQSAQTSAYYQIPVLKKIAERVATQFVSAAATSQTASLASRENIFPQEMINNFHWAFIEDEVTGGAGERNRRAGFCYIGGISPVIYTYGAKTPIHIKPSAITYADPPIQNGEWTIVSNTDTNVVTSDGFNRSRLYYEYDKNKIKLHGVDKGFISERDEAESIVLEKIAKPLALTASETDDLVTDLRAALDAISPSNYVKISLADAKEVETTLPLQVSPAPDHFHRIHLVVEAKDTKSTISAPTFTPLNRTAFTVVELGAVPFTRYE